MRSPVAVLYRAVCGLRGTSLLCLLKEGQNCSNVSMLHTTSMSNRGGVADVVFAVVLGNV
jgi:hypothetical protein